MIWACLSAYEIGQFNGRVNGGFIRKGAYDSVRNEALDQFLVKFIYLEPLNLFMYTWYFLRNLEQEETSLCLKRSFKIFAYVSIVLLPICYLAVFPVWCLEKGYEFYYLGNN
jgi:hypothetical protein